jgi:hypothetical protein
MILDPLGCQCDTNKGKKVNLLDTRGKTPKWVKN